MNLGQIRQNVIDFLRESATPVSVTTAELNRYINDGYRDIARRTHAVVETVTLTLSQYDHFADLPDNSLAPLTFVDLTSGYPIHPVHWTWILKRDATWMTSYRERPSVVAAWGGRKLLFYPAYTGAGMTVSMNHVYMPATTALASDSDTPDLPLQHHKALEHYANWRSLLKDVDSGPRLGRAMKQRSYYENTLSGLEVWGLERHETIRKAIYGLDTHQPGSEI